MRKYCEDNQGQIAVWFAILALPLLAFTTYAVDTMNAEKEKTQLLAALDDAALAAVSRQNITDSERSAYATEYFFQNYDDRKDIEFEVLDSSSNRVELSGKTSVPITFADAFRLIQQAKELLLLSMALQLRLKIFVCLAARVIPVNISHM